jgi:hypothetical protein
MHDCQPTYSTIFGGGGGGKGSSACIYMNISHLSNLNINFWMEKKCKLVHNLVDCNMSCGKMYVVDLAIVAFLKIFIQKLNLPFMFKDKPFISYSLSIVV